MKRLIILLAAALMLTGCSLKKSSDTEPPVENDDKSIEEQITEYSVSEFRRIDIPLEFVDDSKPVEFEILKLSDLGIEERDIASLPEEELSGDAAIDMMELESIRKGKIYGVNIIGEKLFFFADHSISGQVDFDFSLYCYDLAAKELKKLYTYKGVDPPFMIADAMVSEKGDVYFFNYASGTVYKLDTSSGEISEALETNGDICYWAKDRETGQCLIGLQNSETGLLDGYLLTAGGFEPVDYNEIMGYSIEPTEGTENRYDLVTDKVRLHTDFSSFSVESVTDSRITLSWNSVKLFTFDLDKMEMYVTEGADMSCLTPDNNGNFYCNDKNECFLRLFVPELGTAFRLTDVGISAYSPALYHGQPVFFSHDNNEIVFLKEAD